MPSSVTRRRTSIATPVAAGYDALGAISIDVSDEESVGCGRIGIGIPLGIHIFAIRSLQGRDATGMR